jgi:S-adenosylmethionine-diacylglycerol 3-amino-3-carboxypropyl transferase
MEAIEDKIDFSIIRYANCWEDADVLLEALNPHEGNVLSVASAGDNSFAFLTNSNVNVMAVDISNTQLYLCKFKAQAIRQLSCTEFKELIGINASAQRQALLEKVISSIQDKDLLSFISTYKEQLLSGVAYAGKFEKYFEKFRKYLLPLVHRKKDIHELFRTKSAAEHKAFFETRWNNFTWKLLLKIFFSKIVLGNAGRDPGMLTEVKINVGDYIKQKANEHLQSTACQQNYFLQMIMLGTYESALPFYLRDENYEKIKANLDNLYFYKGLIQETPLINNEPYSYVNLSNVFEYMDSEMFAEVAAQLAKRLAPNALLAYWNLMVTRYLHTFPEYEAINKEISLVDNGFFYKKFNLAKRL